MCNDLYTHIYQSILEKVKRGKQQHIEIKVNKYKYSHPPLFLHLQ